MSEDVTELMTDAFNGVTTLTAVYFAENGNLTVIGSNAFKNTSLESAEIPNTVKTLGSNAFDGVTTLKSLTFEEGGEMPVERQGKSRDADIIVGMIKDGATNEEIVNLSLIHI